jgi:hypothetical protein
MKSVRPAGGRYSLAFPFVMATDPESLAWRRDAASYRDHTGSSRAPSFCTKILSMLSPQTGFSDLSRPASNWASPSGPWTLIRLVLLPRGALYKTTVVEVDLLSYNDKPELIAPSPTLHIRRLGNTSI